MRWVAYTIDKGALQLNVQQSGGPALHSQSFGNRGTPAAGRTFIFSVGWAQ